VFLGDGALHRQREADFRSGYFKRVGISRKQFNHHDTNNSDAESGVAGSVRSGRVCIH
jgi:hypothetical protein